MTLRTRYLDLLATTLTNQIYGDAPCDPWSPPGFDRRRRSLGMDWPSQAMTMIGDQRMLNIRHCAEAIIADGIKGDFMECGVWRGGACIYMAGILSAHDDDRNVWVADSFAGLPPPTCQQDEGDKHSTFTALAISVEQVRRNFRKFDLLTPNVRFLPGWFSETLVTVPSDVSLALLRVDADMYASTMDVLTALHWRVPLGGFVIIDDYYAVPACKQAVTDFRFNHGVKAPMQEIDGFGVFWRVGT